MAEEVKAISEGQVKTEDKDEELEELLQSALDDFDKPKCEKAATGEVSTSPSKDEKCDESWGDEFLAQAQKQLEKEMSAILTGKSDGAQGSTAQFEEQLKKMAQEANKVLSEHSRDPQFSATIAETLKNISENSEKIQGDIGEDELRSMLGGLGLGTEEESGNDFMPFMQSMIQSFLSQDLLYPSMKEITLKYPMWLDEHKAALSESDFDNYNKQYKLMEQVCLEFEKETQDDSEDVKKSRFVVIMSLMDDMQKLGQPPKDIVGDEIPFPLNDNGSLRSPTQLDPAQCSIM